MKIINFPLPGDKEAKEAKESIMKNIQESSHFIVIYYDKCVEYQEYKMSAQDIITAIEMTKLDVMIENRGKNND